MKVKFPVLVFALSLLFFSCSNAVQEETSISVDAGQLARFLTKNADYTARSSSANYRSADDEMYYYGMTIKLSTSGTYNASAQVTYKLGLEELHGNPELFTEELLKMASGKQITIEGIPVGARIKVKASLSMGQRINYDRYIEMLKEQNPYITDEEIEEIIEEMKAQTGEADFVIEGSSSEFTVKRGENRIKITLGSDSEDVNEFNIILFSNVSGGNTNGLWSYTMNADGANPSFMQGNSYTSSTISDFVVNQEGRVYYVESDGAIYYSDSDNTSPVSCENDTDLGNDFGIPKLLCLDETGNILFYGATKEEYSDGNFVQLLRIKSYCGGMKDDSTLIVSNYEDTFGFGDDLKADIKTIYDFAVYLGTPEVEEYGDTRTLMYNGYLFIASYYQRYISWGEYEYDKVLTRVPLRYSIEFGEGGISENLSLIKEPDEIISIKLNGDCSLGLPIDGNSVTDMIVHSSLDGHSEQLYVLFENKYAPDYMSTGTPSYPYEYHFNSNGAMLKVDAVDFSAASVSSLIGFNPSITTAISVPKYDDASKQINFYVHQPKSEKEDLFFAPRKFIAVTPKKLVIADDGLFYYKDGDDFCYKNVDRVLVFNTKKTELKAFKLDTSGLIKFSKNDKTDEVYQIKGSDFADENAALCKYKE